MYKTSKRRSTAGFSNENTVQVFVNNVTKYTIRSKAIAAAIHGNAK